MQSNRDEGVLISQHTSLDERLDAAREAVLRLGLTMPVLVDTIDDAVSEAFAAWPERIFVLDAEGGIAYAGGPGPWDFDPDAAASVLERLLETG
jgi:Iodothyronine deiodinase